MVHIQLFFIHMALWNFAFFQSADIITSHFPPSIITNPSQAFFFFKFFAFFAPPSFLPSFPCPSLIFPVSGELATSRTARWTPSSSSTPIKKAVNSQMSTEDHIRGRVMWLLEGEEEGLSCPAHTLKRLHWFQKKWVMRTFCSFSFRPVDAWICEPLKLIRSSQKTNWRLKEGTNGTSAALICIFMCDNARFRGGKRKNKHWRNAVSTSGTNRHSFTKNVRFFSITWFQSDCSKKNNQTVQNIIRSSR